MALGPALSRRAFAAGLAAALMLAGPAAAQSIEDRIISQLQQQGFTRFRLSSTLLGRRRIVAESPGLRREIIVNPRTGEILRDFWREAGTGSGGQPSVLAPDSGRSGSGRDDDDRRRDDDRDDDRRDRDDDRRDRDDDRRDRDDDRRDRDDDRRDQDDDRRDRDDDRNGRDDNRGSGRDNDRSDNRGSGRDNDRDDDRDDD